MIAIEKLKLKDGPTLHSAMHYCGEVNVTKHTRVVPSSSAYNGMQSQVDFELDLVFDNTTVSENFKSTGGNYTGQTQNEIEVKIYAVNYNILKINGGQGGLAYNV